MTITTDVARGTWEAEMASNAARTGRPENCASCACRLEPGRRGQIPADAGDPGRDRLVGLVGWAWWDPAGRTGGTPVSPVSDRHVVPSCRRGGGTTIDVLLEHLGWSKPLGPPRRRPGRADPPGGRALMTTPRRARRLRYDAASATRSARATIVLTAQGHALRADVLARSPVRLARCSRLPGCARCGQRRPPWTAHPRFVGALATVTFNPQSVLEPRCAWSLLTSAHHELVGGLVWSPGGPGAGATGPPGRQRRACTQRPRRCW